MNAYCSQDTIETQQDESVKPDTTTAEPLAPPPRPDTAASAIGATPDYFSVAHLNILLQAAVVLRLVGTRHLAVQSFHPLHPSHRHRGCWVAQHQTFGEVCDQAL
jgi:hypothetical protein